MKKEYYIQGDPVRAEEIKAAFEELGINVLDFGFADKTVIYCSIGECVQYLPYSINLMNILYSHPDYTELPLSVKSKPKFKVGDWLLDKEKGEFPVLIAGYDEEKGYLAKYNIGIETYFWRDIIENEYRLWEFSDAKEGDVLVVNGNSKEYKWIGIFKAHTSDTSFSSHCHYNCGMCEFVTHIARCRHGTKYNDIRPATTEERDLLFSKMEEAGYQWDAVNKELRKIQPHYDIKNFHVGMPVLVRADNNCRWDYSVFSRITGNESWQFAVCNGVSFTQCIPFEGNEKLLGTTDMCEERFINW